MTFLKYSWLLVLPMVAAAAIVWKASAAEPEQKCPPPEKVLDHTVLIPNTADCSTYFSCSNGVAILLYCPDGLYFNAELNLCDWPRNVDTKDCTQPESEEEEEDEKEEEKKYNICYSESEVVKGRTYYDCGDCCNKIYDEKGKGHASKCFYKKSDCE